MITSSEFITIKFILNTFENNSQSAPAQQKTKMTESRDETKTHQRERQNLNHQVDLETHSPSEDVGSKSFKP